MPIEKSSILFVDDNKDDFIVFDEALSKLEIPYSILYSPYYVRHIFKLLDEHKINIIFTDVNMPGKSGIKLLEDLKANEKYRDIPVIMYSVSVREEDIAKSYELGAHFYVVKAYSHRNLVEALRKVFKLDWSLAQPATPFEDFVINHAFV